MRKTILLILPLAACTGPAVWGPAPVPVSATAARVVADTTHPIPREVHWVRNSAEHHAALLQAYRVAGDQLKISSRGKVGGTWAVILDTDETVFDNSTFEKGIADNSGADTVLVHWQKLGVSQALPGAVEFEKLAHALGGRVLIVTGRQDSVCNVLRRNLNDVGFHADMVLCAPPGAGSDKNPRFRAVANGTAVLGVPPLQILMWIGDSITDFPNMTQGEFLTAADAAFADFGRKYIIIPNPMYGSFVKNPYK